MVSKRKTEIIEEKNYSRKYVYDINNKDNFELLNEERIVGNKKYKISKTLCKYDICICNNIIINYSILENPDPKSYEKTYEISYNFLQYNVEARYLELDKKGSCHKSEVVDEKKLNEHINKVLSGFEEAENEGVLDGFSKEAIEIYELLIYNLEKVKSHAI